MSYYSLQNYWADKKLPSEKIGKTRPKYYLVDLGSRYKFHQIVRVSDVGAVVQLADGDVDPGAIGHRDVREQEPEDEQGQLFVEICFGGNELVSVRQDGNLLSQR